MPINKKGPLSPDEIDELKKMLIPEEMFDAFNEMIAKNYSNGKSSFRQDDVLDLAIVKFIESGKLNSPKFAGQEGDYKSFIRAKIFDEHWLDVEPSYRKEGWKVEYDKPGYNETYSASFVFSRSRQSTSPVGGDNL